MSAQDTEGLKHLYIGTNVPEGDGDFTDATLEYEDGRLRLELSLTEEQTRDLRDTLNKGLGEHNE